MPASHRSDGSMKHSTKVMATLKWKASKVIKALLPKKKRKGLTGDAISLSDTSSTKSNEPSIIDESTSDMEEGADAELGMSPLYSYNKKELIMKFRIFEKGLECTDLHLLPSRTHY